MTFKPLFKEKWACILLYLIAAFLCVVTVFFAVLHYSVHTLQIGYLAPPVILAVLSVVLFVKLAGKWKEDPSLMFLFIAAPTVFAFCIFMMPGSVPDEYSHICRMFSLSTSGAGNMVIPSAFAHNVFPTSYEQLCNSLTTAYTWSDFSDTRDMSLYLPHMYIIPGIFSELFEMLNINPFITIFFCRGINATLFLIAGYWMLKILPLGKTLGFVYLLNPMLMQQEASCSADAFVNIVGLLFIAVVLNARFTKGKLSKLQISSLVILAILVPLSKYVYIPLLLILFILLPRIKNKKISIALIAGVIAFILLALIVIVGFYQSESYASSLELVRDPALFVSVISKTFYTFSLQYLEQFAGSSLGLLTIRSWPVLFVLYYCLITATFFVSTGEKYQLNRIEKTLAYVLPLVIMVILMVATRPWSLTVDSRGDVIDGIQGRYFLPIALLPLLTGINPKRTFKSDTILIKFGIVMIIIDIAAIIAICVYFLWK